MLKNNMQNLHAKSILLNRHRIMLLMENGIKSSLFTIVSPPGYGKTHEVTKFLVNTKIKLRYIWMRITQLDNLSEHFWKNFLAVLSKEFPNFAEKLRFTDFPDTLSKFDLFIRAIAEETYNGPMMVFVIDDYDSLENQEIKAFLRYILESNLENFCLLVIGRKNIDLELDMKNSGIDIFRLSVNDLKFTFDEIKEFFTLSEIHLADDLLQKITNDTDGWPLLIYLLSLWLKLKPNSYQKSRGQSMENIKSLFEHSFFASYPADIKQLLIKLSFTPSFSLNMVGLLGNVDVQQFLKVLDSNVFVVYNEATSQYTFQNVYKEFLSEKQFFISPDERAHVFEVAGDYFSDIEEPLHAIECYSQAQNYKKMMLSMIGFLGSYLAINKTNCRFILDKMDTLPKDIMKDNYLLDYIRVVIYIQLFQINEAMELSKNAEMRLLANRSDESDLILGEFYERMAGIHMMLRHVCAMEYYKKAAEYLPNGSNFKNKCMLRFKNFSVFSIEEYTKGAIERMENALYEGIEYMNQVEKGSASGFHYLYSTEAAYYTHNLDRAKEMAHKTIAEAKKANQHDILCNALFMLAKVECINGNYQEVLENVKSIREYVQQIQVAEMDEVADFADNWFAFTMNPSNDVISPFLITKSEFASMTPLFIGRSEMFYAIYLLQCEKYMELIAYLEQIKDLYATKGWGDSLTSNVMLSLAYFKYGDKEKAMEIMWETYSMTYQNGIIMPFVEVGNSMRTLVEYARQSSYAFDREWLDNIYRKASAFAKRLSAMIKTHKKANIPSQKNKINLSKRELDVLYGLSKGLTRNEIADLYGLSVNTIKTTTTNLYNKLGAINRADAIRIASFNKLIN